MVLKGGLEGGFKSRLAKGCQKHAYKGGFGWQKCQKSMLRKGLASGKAA